MPSRLLILLPSVLYADLHRRTENAIERRSGVREGGGKGKEDSPAQDN
jgi:hypothetical protein